MSTREKFKSFKGRLKDKARQLVGSSPAQSTSSLPNDPPPSISPMPGALTPSGSAVPTARPVSAPPSNAPVVVDHSWAPLEGFLRVLTKSSTVFGPLKMAMEDLAQCIAMHEEAAAARRDYETLKSELEALFSALSGHFAGEAPPTMTASMDNLCSAIEKELARISSKGESSNARRHWEAKEDMGEVMECYRRIQGHLNRLALNADLSTWKIVDELATETRFSKLQPSMSACYDSAEAALVRRRECTPQTREEVLAELGTWTHDREQGNIYWLNGMAGTGKTTIATSLCAMLKRTHEIGASFFCTRQLPECRDVKRILPTIAYQLASFSRPFRCALSRALERDPDVGTKALPLQLEGLIVGPLREVAQTLPTDLVVVIDALDECDDINGVEHILEMLVRYASDLPIKVFVSSRPESQIYKKIGSMKSQLVLHELDDKIVKGDIEIYLRAELSDISVSESQLSDLVDRAGVLFIYAATVVRYIKARDFYLGQQKRLNAVLGSPLATSSNQNKDIDALYDVVLASAFSNPELEDSDKEHIQLVLWTVLCAQEPLTVDALAGLLQLGDGDWVRAALQPLWSVLHISGVNSLVNTLHASFPDYMLSPQRSKEHGCNAEVHHGRLAELCFARIQSNERQFNICELESSYVLDEQVPNLDDRVNRAIPLDLAYACQYWAVHLELGEWSYKRMQLLHEFLSVRLLLWMEVLNLRKQMNIGPEMLSKTRKWCMGQDSASDTKDLVHDAWRFVTTFAANPVSRSTPHIYVSMLAFWPSLRPMRVHYFPRTSCVIDVKGTAITRRELDLLGMITTEAGVVSVALSPDGTRIASTSVDAIIRVWDGQSGQMVLGLQGHTGSVSSVAFSPDGMRIVSGSSDKTIRVWDGQSGQMVLGPLRGHTALVMSVEFSPDGTRIVSGSWDDTICVWDGQSGQMVLGPLEDHTAQVNSVVFSHDSMRIVSGSGDKTVRVWDGQSGQMVLGPLEGHTDSVSSVAFSPDGMRIVSGSWDNTICVWDGQSGQMVLGPLKGHTEPVHSVAFSHDSLHIVSGSSDKTIRVWDGQSGEMALGPLQGHTHIVKLVAFSHDNMRIISGSWDGTIRVWDRQSAETMIEPLNAHTDSVNLVVFSPDGMQIVSGSSDNTIRVWDSESGQMVLGPLEGHTDSVNSVAFSPDGVCIISGSEDETMRVWDRQSGQLVLGPLEGYTGSVFSIAFSPDGTQIVFGSDDEEIHVWDRQSGQTVLGPLQGHTEPINSVAFSPDGMRIVSCSDDKTIRVWDGQSGNMALGPLKGHTKSINSVVFSPDGMRIVSGSGDKTIRVWDGQSGKMVLGPLEGHTSSVYSVAFSPDGMRIVSGSLDKTIRVWDGLSGQMVLGPLEGHTSLVYSVAFSPDGMRIVSGSRDKTIRVWDAQTPDSSTSAPPIHITTHAPGPASSFGAPSLWRLNTAGWVIDEHQRILLWVPHDLRDRLLVPPNICTISAQGSVQLNFDHAKLGALWTECYLPASL